MNELERGVPPSLQQASLGLGPSQTSSLAAKLSASQYAADDAGGGGGGGGGAAGESLFGARSRFVRSSALCVVL